ncbi:hypothetical protein [Deinococcus peraridilitoris]|uniref:Uncharacterized protein n=1 Tax=Deinococcus peraridilitoris (strain DSM 19664 / LMG 22246 / CIP 109416 / KR-200) TaxID=937777 RepID=L0A3L8_DEIPD|nr:hypothetical protein [Deinococcus peraridilitoris]AFZ67777.1 hypothetical protein Deipe_2296 [Deinococcus peraridilitoris DSM 19664]
MRLVIYHPDKVGNEGLLQETSDGPVLSPGTRVLIERPGSQRAVNNHLYEIQAGEHTFVARRDPSTGDDMAVRIYHVSNG